MKQVNPLLIANHSEITIHMMRTASSFDIRLDVGSTRSAETSPPQHDFEP